MWSILQPISILFNCGLLLHSILSSDCITIGKYIPIMITMQFFATQKKSPSETTEESSASPRAWRWPLPASQRPASNQLGCLNSLVIKDAQVLKNTYPKNHGLSKPGGLEIPEPCSLFRRVQWFLGYRNLQSSWNIYETIWKFLCFLLPKTSATWVKKHQVCKLRGKNSEIKVLQNLQGGPRHQLGVSKNKGSPKWMVYNGKPY